MCKTIITKKFNPQRFRTKRLYRGNIHNTLCYIYPANTVVKSILSTQMNSNVGVASSAAMTVKKYTTIASKPNESAQHVAVSFGPI